MGRKPKRYVHDGLGQCLGSDLPERLQAEALSQYVHRFTGDHKPAWARQLMPNGRAYPVQFASDKDWLAHTTFCIEGRPMRLANADCYSCATWPDNPELRSATMASGAEVDSRIPAGDK